MKIDLPDDFAARAPLKQLILDRRNADRGVIRSNINGWHSTDDMLDWGGAHARSIINIAGSMAATMVKTHQNAHPGKADWRCTMWANVSGRGAANHFHAHNGWLVSGVYYVDDGYDGANDPALGGKIVFRDPRYPMAYMHRDGVNFSDPGGRLVQPSYGIRPKTNMMLLFPAWIDHGVDSYFGAGQRISIAFNMDVAATG